MPQFISLFAMVVALALPVVPSVSHAQVSPALARKAPDAAEMMDAAGKKGYVRIIAEFTGPVPAGQLTPDPAQLAPIKERIASMRDAIVATHFGSATNPRAGQGFPRGLQSFEIRPMFAVNVSKTELEALAADPRVVHIHLDRLMRPLLPFSVPHIGMLIAYNYRATGAGQAVAILDTGVESNHEFLAGKVVMAACFSNSGGGGGGVSLCPNGLPTQMGPGAADVTTGACVTGGIQLCSHGTHVAGIAAGNNTNPGGGGPPNGVARNADIVAVQVFTRFNDAATCGGMPPCLISRTSDLISALDFVFMNALTPAPGVRLASVNMSLGGGTFPAACDTMPEKPSIDNLRAAGVVSAIAAGNDGNTDAIGSPACISTAVAVGSSDKRDVISSFSDMSSLVKLMGPGGFFGNNGGQPCLPAPGFNPDIRSSFPGNTPAQTNLYGCIGGTSMAAPHVAGAFAAIRTACPTATVDQILTALQNTGKPIADTRPGGTQTKPRIQVDRAVVQLSRSTRMCRPL
jgi:Subtilase family